MLLEYATTHLGAITPRRSNSSDAGMDLFYCPENTEEVIMIPPLGKAKIPTGIKFAIPHGFALEIKNRSSVAANKGLVVGACIVDPGYSGEVVIDLHNISQMPQEIHPGEKIAQFVVYPVVHVRLINTDESELYDDEEPIAMSRRGDGGFGSTNQGKE